MWLGATEFKRTNCSRGVRNAWHFYCALVLVIKAVCSGISIESLTRQQDAKQ
ncbi:DUF3265 domain-containing protein [Vibrio alginolyticus]|nr:DUF3265 domain-containing protein [Vibrio diabolicus]EJL6785390.1 DUF3265 domain-containing protein [Vibrio alginolyticus]MDG2789031.1 DUF3265 domain-containing protein [Vibrio parahaemolyticus]MDK9730763.1 DUF3265 domain-containing protein [Vibrio sp. D415a]MDK9746274.1 DUF3265 domain-containing protein [Vibrio sp. D409a]MDK9769296.1 DUF3265 domain-containing protein [Vibrio sp. D417a]MDK9789302.1 DUF3265 domain-containing protein [Vibrio sp. D421a]NNN59121.1 DUF3265 domain-containing pr